MILPSTAGQHTVDYTANMLLRNRSLSLHAIFRIWNVIFGYSVRMLKWQSKLQHSLPLASTVALITAARGWHCFVIVSINPLNRRLGGMAPLAPPLATLL